MSIDRLIRGCAPIALMMPVLLLAACRAGSLTVQLGADAPAETARNVFVTLQGVELKRDDGSLDDITLKENVRIDLLNFDRDSSFALIDNDSLGKGRYTGIRLLFSDDTSNKTDNYVVDVNGAQQPITFSDDDSVFAPIDITAKKNGGKSYSLQLQLDLRLSLSMSDSGRSLKPVLRAVRDKDAATITGSVPDRIVRGNACENGRNAGVGVAVYAFSGKDVTPKDYQGASTDPFATTPVVANGSSNWTYTLRSMPSGDYTLALTCQGDKENPTQPDDLSFIDTQNVSLKKGEMQDAGF